MSGEGTALTFLMQMLTDEVKAYSDLKKGAQHELEQLQDELRLLAGYLKDAADISKKTNAFKEMEMKIRKVVYEVEDTIDTYLAKKAATKNKNVFARIKGISGTTLEQTVRDLRVKTVAPALQLLSFNGKEKQPTGGEKKDDSSAIKLVGVELTYSGLEYHEKMCFLYTGLFPEGYEIPASTLTQLWIAEKFILPEDQMSLEETAKKLLKDLVDKDLLVAKKMRLDQVKTCQVDAAIRDFCINKAKEENLFTVVIESSVHREQSSFYRLCFHSNPSNFLSTQPNLPNVRSFLCLVTEPLRLEKTHISTIPKAFKPLRILNCTSTKFEVLPKNLASLILLKHVTLSIDNLQSLPEEISKLSNLQTLIVKTESAFIKVQANIWKMKQLRHLKTKVSFVLDDKRRQGSAAHENLQTITRLSTESCSETLYQKAPNLKSLGIRGELYNLDLERLSLEKFCRLEKLKLVNYVHFGLASKSPLDDTHDRFPPKLKRLTLLRTYLVWDTHMTILARINNLEVLKVKDNAFKGAVWNARKEDKFNKLHYLLIDNTDLHIWKADSDQFPNLKCLVINNCENLRSVPASLQQVVKLDNDHVSRNH